MAKTKSEGRSHQFLKATGRRLAPGLTHTLVHELGTEELHVTVSIRTWGKLRRLEWTKEALFYELEGTPKAVTFKLEKL
jgi:hypothetical protein